MIFNRPTNYGRGVSGLLFILPTVFLSSCAAPPADLEYQPPNILFILVDDLGWRDVGSFGSPFYETPNIDQLTREGMQFTNAYAAAPVCSPARSGILTGKYPARLHQTDWIPGMDNSPQNKLMQVEDLNFLPLSEVTLAERLGAAGYVTAHVGKWHLGGEGYLPTDQGFTLNVAGTYHGSPPGYFWPYGRRDSPLAALAKTGEEGEYLTDRLTKEAIQFIEDNADAPFFLHLSYYAVHLPLEGKPDLVQKYEAKAATVAPGMTEIRDGLTLRTGQSDPVYAAMVETVDLNVGKVLRALEDYGVAEKTLVVFTSDNGGLSYWPADRGDPPTSNSPLRAGKGWLYEGGIRVPLVVRWPGVAAPGSRSEVPVSGIDFYPTLLEAAGVEPEADMPLDGVSLVPLLRQKADVGREALYWHYPHYHGSGARPAGAVRQDDFKLIEFLEDGRLELYNLREDLAETNDLAGPMMEQAENMRTRLHEWRDSVGAQMPERNPEWQGSMDP